MEGQRLRFETNFDELVDAYQRYFRRAKSGPTQRRRGTTAVATLFTVSLYLTLLLFFGGGREILLPMAGVALVVGGALWPLHRRYNDYVAGRQLRRALIDQLGGESNWVSEFELRKEGMWCPSRGNEFLFNWRDLTIFDASQDTIEFHFRSGFMMVRDRAFSSPAERAAFIESARQLSAR